MTENSRIKLNILGTVVKDVIAMVCQEFKGKDSCTKFYTMKNIKLQHEPRFSRIKLIKMVAKFEAIKLACVNINVLHEVFYTNLK